MKNIYTLITLLFLLLYHSPSWAQSSSPMKKLNWIMPVVGVLTNPFGNGYRFYGDYRGGHTGVDIKADKGTPIFAVADGTVKYINLRNNRRYGFTVVIEHEPYLYTLYGHLQTIVLKRGQAIKRGEKIGTVGTTGAAGYPHLHFEVINRMPKNDGAWGYYYICTPSVNKKKVTFLDASAIRIDHIIRYSKNGCHSIKREPIVYFNPERFLTFPQKETLANSVKLPAFHSP